jgi:hypothetical protein
MATKGLSKETLDFTQRIQRAFPHNLRGSVLRDFAMSDALRLVDMKTRLRLSAMQ